VVRSFADRRGARYEPVGGLNPRDAPPALCPGGRNRVTGELVDGYWGAFCDASEERVGGLFAKAVLPRAIVAKSHMPDLTDVVPRFDVESLEARPDEYVKRFSGRRVEFESLEFNRRFLARVPADHDPVRLRELFSPGFIDWVTTIDRPVDFGANDSQLWFLWRLRERTAEELELAVGNAGEMFERAGRELAETGAARYEPGPWNAGLKPFPG
jgi:hypothetical protein